MNQITLNAFVDEMLKIATTPSFAPPMVGATGKPPGGLPPQKFTTPAVQGAQAVGRTIQQGVQAQVGAAGDAGKSFLRSGAGLVGPGGMAALKGAQSLTQRIFPTTRVGDVLSGPR